MIDFFFAGGNASSPGSDVGANARETSSHRSGCSRWSASYARLISDRLTGPAEWEIVERVTRQRRMAEMEDRGMASARTRGLSAHLVDFATRNVEHESEHERDERVVEVSCKLGQELFERDGGVSKRESAAQ